MFTKCTDIHLKVDGHDFAELPIAPFNNKFSNHEYAKSAEISFTYQTLTTPATNAKIIYNIDDVGHIKVTMRYYGKKGLPPLPVIGIRLIMPTAATGFDYEGLSGETYLIEWLELKKANSISMVCQLPSIWFRRKMECTCKLKS